jgi:hypothetical protein
LACVVFDDVDLGGKDAGEDLDYLVARDVSAEAEQIAADGSIDVGAHSLESFLLGDDHDVVRVCGGWAGVGAG